MNDEQRADAAAEAKFNLDFDEMLSRLTRIVQSYSSTVAEAVLPMVAAQALSSVSDTPEEMEEAITRFVTSLREAARVIR